MDIETFALMLVGLVVPFAALYFFFLRIKTNPRVEPLAQAAYEFAADVLGVEAKGSPPPVVLKKARWNNRVGEYKRIALPFGIVLWDKISVVADASSIFRNLAHEMAHALRARAGKKSTEEEAEMIELAAWQYRLTNEQISTLLTRLDAGVEI